MTEDSRITPADGKQKAESPPPFLLPPEDLPAAVHWALTPAGEDDVAAVVRELRLVLSRGAPGSVHLALTSERFRTTAVQDFIALEELDVLAGRAVVRTRHLLPAWSDPDYSETLRAFAEQFGYLSTRAPHEIERWLNRFDLWRGRPDELRDPEPCLQPFDLAARLGIRFAPGVNAAEAAATLHGLDGQLIEFMIRRDWIATVAQQIQQRREAAKPLEVRYSHSGTIGHSGTIAHRGSIEHNAAQRDTSESEKSTPVAPWFDLDSTPAPLPPYRNDPAVDQFKPASPAQIMRGLAEAASHFGDRVPSRAIDHGRLRLLLRHKFGVDTSDSAIRSMWENSPFKGRPGPRG